MEYVPGGEFFSYLRKRRNLPEEHCRFYASQVGLFFDYLHGLNYLYRDLKPENMLICKDGYIKLTDFGFAKEVRMGDKTYTICGTPEYLAPEIVQNLGYDKAVDWWTLGILIYEMVYGAPPYVADSPYEIYKKILSRNIVFPKIMSVECRNLVKKLLNHSPTTRCGTMENGSLDFFYHSWFHGAQFKHLDVIQKKVNSPFLPRVGGIKDTSNFDRYSDSEGDADIVSGDRDVFETWPEF